jgi:hypothetical protein
MSALHPTEEDEAADRANKAEGFRMRIRWVLQLREALKPFTEGAATSADVERAKRVLTETSEWLTPDMVK